MMFGMVPSEVLQLKFDDVYPILVVEKEKREFRERFALLKKQLNTPPTNGAS